MNAICSAELGSRYATRFPFDVVEPALKRGPALDCRYRGRRDSGTPDECSVAVLIDEIQCFNQNEGCFHVHYVCVHCAYDGQLSALADSERRPAINRRVSVENEPLVA